MSGVLVTAVGSMSAEHVLRSLRRQGYGPIFGTDTHPAAWLPASRLTDGMHRLPQNLAPDAYAQWLMAICKDAAIRRIVPLTDPEVDILAPRAAEFLSQGMIICAPGARAVDRCRDKLALHEAFAADPEVSTIPTVALDGPPPGDFPLLAKPRRGRSSQGLFMIEDSHALAYARARWGATHVLQPYRPGDVVVVDIVRHPVDGHCIALARTELLRTSNGAGTTVRMAGGAGPLPAAFRAAQVLDVHGCVNFEFMHHGGRHLLMDANPRFSAGVAFSAMAGYDMVAAHMACFEGGDLPPPPTPSSAIFIRRLVEVAADDNNRTQE